MKKVRPPYHIIREYDYLSIDFFLTKSCNKDCYYCTSYTLEMRNLVVDMDFLRMVLDSIKDYKVIINLLGGEPGLVKNLDEVISEIKKYDNFIVAILSNSFVRKRYPSILKDPEIYYLEHLVLDFEEDSILKLGNYDFFEENEYNNYNLIIRTPKYESYRVNHRLNIDHKNTIIKEYNSRSPSYNITTKDPELERRLCAKFPKVPVVDFENKTIRHCSKKTIISRTFDCNPENLKLMMQFDLFEYEDYCQSCTEKIYNYTPRHIIKFMNDNGSIR